MSYSSGSARQRPNLWSYISFSSGSRRDASSLPMSEQAGRGDDHAKVERIAGRPRASTNPASSYPNVYQAQRSKLFKVLGAATAFLVILFLFTAPGSNLKNFATSKMHQQASQLTTRCSKSADPNKPLIQYALMIDAGSTGSRIHVYKFNNCGSTPELEDEVFKMTEKKKGGSGLSSYDADAEGAARSLDVLLDEAVRSVPVAFQSCSPVAVKATAGLRKLGKEKSERILRAVRDRITNEYPFPLISEEHHGVEVMDGTDEGVYAWITTNYLLGKIGGPDNTPTAAVFDLGGGSTQIVFQPTFPLAPDGGMPEKLAEGDHKYELSFGGREFDLYQHSYLGYGLMEARNQIHRLVVQSAYEMEDSADSVLNSAIVNPCLIPGTSQKVKVEMTKNHPLGSVVTVNMVGPQSNSAAQCRALAERILNKESSCALTPCAFNGVHQPSLERTFAREDVYLFSYFYDRTKPLGMPESFTLNELHDVTSKVCDGEKSWSSFKSTPGALDELKDRPEHCLDLNFMLALLHTGYEMPMTREVKIAKKIRGNELGWCLGASLPLLGQESGWTCKVKQIA